MPERAVRVPRTSRLDELLPRFDVVSRHRIAVNASPAVTFAALEASDPRESPVVRFLMRVRGFGARTRAPERASGLVESLSGFGFIPLGGRPGEEVVFGLVGKFWTPAGGLRKMSPAAFADFAEEGYARAAWNLTVTPAAVRGSILATETRVLCSGSRARARFRAYWTLVRPFSGLLRREMLRRVRARALEIARDGRRGDA